MSASIEDSYQLSPLQEGMLLHRALAPDSGGEIFQLVASLPEDLDAAALRRAWQRIVDRYAIFRTSFRWQDGDRAVQEVHGEALLLWHEEDWRGRPEDEQDELVESFLRADRERGFDLAQPPLIRMALFRRAEASWSFVWTAYHGVVDGRSAWLVLVEAFTSYEALRRGEEPASSPVQPFRRYVEWLAAQDMAAAEAYWKRLLLGFEAPTRLATAKVGHRLRAAGVAHSDHELALPEATTATLEKVCAERAITFHTLLQAAWALLWSRYSGTRDVVFGGLKSNRAAVPEGERIVGPLINTLIMRVAVLPETRLDDFLAQVREQWLAHRPYEFVPLGRVQQWSGIPAAARLFESMVVFENYRWSDSLRALGGAWRDRELLIHRQPEYPLTLYGFKGRRLSAKLIYDRRAFDATTVVRMLGHLERILAAVAAAPGCRLAEVEILTPAERGQLLVEWNDTGAPFDLLPVHRAFEARVEERPEAEAVVDGEVRLTYAELNRRADRWARFLVASGVGPEVPVALCLRRSAALVTAALAVLKAGGAYAALDPAQSPGRLAMMLADLGGPLLLTHEDLRPGLAELGGRAIAVDREPPGAPSWEGPNLDRPTLPRQLAYLIYTSGSTGRPKGVAVAHQSLSNLVAWRGVLAVSAADRGTLIVNPAFDPWMWELWPYLTAGASVRVPPDEVVRSPVRLRDWLLAQGITGCVVPTPIAELLLALDWPLQVPLRRLLIGGDRLNGRPAPDLGFPVFNVYGPAECTVVATAERLTARSEEARPPAIGRPMDNVGVYLLDPERRPVPIGVVGELHLHGEGLARGYWNRPRETAERFVPDPFSGASGARLYRTGDLASFDAAGRLHFCGRVDHQVKIRGNRVELGEIETNLAQHPGIDEAVVVLRERGQQQHLVAFCTPAGGRAPSAQELRQFLRQRLPAYMVPAGCVLLERLPRTPHGKVDRRALPASDTLFAAAERAYEPPRSGQERAVAEVWRQVLGLAQVGLDDDFYEVGGHSLALIRIQEALRVRFGLDVRTVDLFENPTVRLQAMRLGRPVAATDPEPEILAPTVEGEPA